MLLSFSPWLPLVLGCLALALSAWSLFRGIRPRPFVEINPVYRPLLQSLGLTEADAFFALEATLVSGHTDRNVARLTLGVGPDAMRAFLKREHWVPWTARLASWWAGFGLGSRSVREARTLEALTRAGIGCASWLAVGEDGAGRAFILLQEVPGAVELRAHLAHLSDRRLRHRFARRLGVAVARLHGAGFTHPDLYAKHILVDPTDGAIRFLDWQRSGPAFAVSWRQRARDLAALHATLADDEVTGRERLAFYCGYCRALRAEPPQMGNPSPVLFLNWVETATRRLLRRRHVREKRRTATGLSQAWLRLDGDALCVTPTLRQLTGGRTPDWLPLDRQPVPTSSEPTRRWMTLPGAAPALLERRRRECSLTVLWRRWRRRPLVSPEQEQAALLLRLQRHGIRVPHVLAMGQRDRGGGQDSFLLTLPPAEGIRLDGWLARTAHSPSARRKAVLREAGGLLRRLHEAGCYLGPKASGCVFALYLSKEDAPALGLESVDDLRPARRPRPDLAAQDVARLAGALTASGCDTHEQKAFSDGYHSESASSEIPPAPPQDDPGDNLSPPDPPAASGGFWRRLLCGARRLIAGSDWPRFAGADWPDRIMDVAVTDRFHAKQGRSTGRWILPDPDGAPPRLTVYLKRHYRLSWWRGLLATFWPGRGWSPALQEWHHLEWARRLGVPVPRAVAAAEYIGPWGRLRSVLAVEELTGMLPLHEAIPLAARRLTPAIFRRWKRSLVIELARLTRLLHDRRCFHKDLYLCHFYIPEADTVGLPVSWRGRVHLIDLHRLAHHPWTWRLWQVKDLAQLLYSSAVEGIEIRDRLAFWRAYLGPNPATSADRWLRRWVLLKWRRYQRHNARRRA